MDTSRNHKNDLLQVQETINCLIFFHKKGKATYRFILSLALGIYDDAWSAVQKYNILDVENII